MNVNLEWMGVDLYCCGHLIQVSIRDKVFDVMLYFIRHEDEEVKHKALPGLSQFNWRYHANLLI